MSRDAWIRTIPEDEADGELAELYRQEMDRRHNVVDNIMKIHSLHPATLRDHAAIYHTLMHEEAGLSRAEREMIGVVVSTHNRCEY
jgi:uncharacterized peroxidase-related enzyme